MKLIWRCGFLIFLMFILPALLSLGVWQTKNHAANWRVANWSSSGFLPAAEDSSEAVIYLMSARTGRWKGAFSVHSWIVVKDQLGKEYRRYEVVGWGKPVRRNAYAADAQWYSNESEIIASLRGKKAETLIPRIEKIIASYPHGAHGAYIIWPGPNSNSFVAHILNEVPELGWALPPNAVGRDFIATGKMIHIDPDWQNLRVSLFGYAGFSVGKRHGFELNFLGLVFGFDFSNFALKLPGFGRLPVWR